MDKENFLYENSLNYFCDVQLTNLEWLFIDRVVIPRCQEQGVLVPNKKDLLKQILAMAMSNKTLDTIG